MDSYVSSPMAGTLLRSWHKVVILERTRPMPARQEIGIDMRPPPLLVFPVSLEGSGTTA